MKILSFFFLFLFSLSLHGEPLYDFIAVKTFAPKNREVKVWYRVPDGYEVSADNYHRVLVLFGGRNYKGEGDVKNGAWGKWADENGIFLVSPGFTDDNYWEPQKWSGAALYGALDELRKKYRVRQDKLFFYGYSAGAQCSNTFPAFRPTQARAWVSHACGYFHKPTSHMKDIPGLITCGDADRARFMISKSFIEEYRKLGANILWKSFPNRPHDVPDGSLHLARKFFEYYNVIYADDLKSGILASKSGEPKKILFIGDDGDGVIYPESSPEAKNIDPSDRVFFTSEEIARAWEESTSK